MKPRRVWPVGTIARAILLGCTWLALATTALGASPTPSTMPGGDPRSSGQGPGLVGDPILAVAAVLLVGVVALAVTLAYVRMTAHGDR